MKRWISCFIILVIVMSTCSTALAEEFEVRNGIRFGMTVSEVKLAEGNQHLLRSDWKKEKYNNSLRYWYLTLAGIDGSSLKYTFDLESDLLCEIVYSFEADTTNNSQQHVMNQLSALYTDLLAKYGEPLHNCDGDYFASCTDEFATRIQSLQTSSSSKLLAYVEWLVPYDSYWVVIDLVGYGTGYPRIDSYHYFLAYKIVSNETVMELLLLEYDREVQRDNDL